VRPCRARFSGAFLAVLAASKDLAAAFSALLLRAEGQSRGRPYLATEDLYLLQGGGLFIDVSGPPHAARDQIVVELSERLAWTGDAFGFTEPGS
jgi:hypothetical protein